MTDNHIHVQLPKITANRGGFTFGTLRDRMAEAVKFHPEKKINFGAKTRQVLVDVARRVDLHSRTNDHQSKQIEKLERRVKKIRKRVKMKATNDSLFFEGYDRQLKEFLDDAKLQDEAVFRKISELEQQIQSNYKNSMERDDRIREQAKSRLDALETRMDNFDEYVRTVVEWEAGKFLDIGRRISVHAERMDDLEAKFAAHDAELKPFSELAELAESKREGLCNHEEGS